MTTRNGVSRWAMAASTVGDGYGVITSVPVATDIWRARDTDGNPATEEVLPPAGLRYASYFQKPT